MPSVYSLKPRLQGLLRPLVRRLAHSGVTANNITVFACVSSIVLGLFLTLNLGVRFWLLLPVWFVIRMALNAMDGMLAREFDQKSNLGACLNEIGDVVSDSFLYLPFAYVPNFDPLWVGIIIVLSVISEMAGVTPSVIGGGRRYDGPMGKSDRALVFGVIGLWIGLSRPVSPWFSYWLVRVIVVLLAVTIVNRIRRGLAEANARVLKAGVGLS